MKASLIHIARIPCLLLLLSGLTAGTMAGQTHIGILPVSLPAAVPAALTLEQWQGISSSLHGYLAESLAEIGGITRLSREHILLLLKEKPSQDPDRLDPESLRQICKKEKLDYLLKCTVEDLLTGTEDISAIVRIVIFDGNNGDIYWEGSVRNEKYLGSRPAGQSVLLDELLKPSIDDLSQEIKHLKY